jgi:hypothetical protein
MQTFLLHKEFKETAKLLDTPRLNKQRVECFQIYNCIIGLRLDSVTQEIVGEAKGFLNHPAVRMWKESPAFLCLYAQYISKECAARDIADHRQLGKFFDSRMLRHPFRVPMWWTEEKEREKIIYSHRCNMIRKDPEFYGPKFPELTLVDSFTPYHWSERR